MTGGSFRAERAPAVERGALEISHASSQPREHSGLSSSTARSCRADATFREWCVTARLHAGTTRALPNLRGEFRVAGRASAKFPFCARGAAAFDASPSTKRSSDGAAGCDDSYRRIPITGSRPAVATHPAPTDSVGVPSARRSLGRNQKSRLALLPPGQARSRGRRRKARV